MRWKGILGAMFLAGCVAVQKRGFDSPLDQVHQAAKKAVQELKLTPGADSIDFQASIVRATMADGRRVTIRAEKASDRHTTVSVAVGDVSNEVNRAAAQTIMDHMAKSLGQ